MTAESVSIAARARRRRRARAGDAVAMRAALSPVSAALANRAADQAASERERSDAEADAEMTRARAEAERLLAEARAEGATSAERATEKQLALARREAHEMVLAARRRAYETLRAAALLELTERLAAPEGRPLRAQMAAWVRDRLGDPGAVVHTENGTVEAVRSSGGPSAVLDLSVLLDAALASCSEQVSTLWT